MTASCRWAVHVVRAFLGAVFLFAGSKKFGEPLAFADSIHSYGLFPRNLINPLAAGLPILEICLGVMLLFGLAKRVSAVTAVLLYIAFIGIIIQAKFRGLEIDCGCFGAGDTSAGSLLAALVRDIGLLGGAVFVLLRTRLPSTTGRLQASP